MGKVYHHVFGVLDSEPGALWFHEFSADTASDARAETDSMKNQGYRTRVIRSAADPLTLLERVAREDGEDKRAKFGDRVLRVLEREEGKERCRRWARFIAYMAGALFDLDEKAKPDAAAYAIQLAMENHQPPADAMLAMLHGAARDLDDFDAECAAEARP